MYSWRICWLGDGLLGFCLRSCVRLDVSSFYLVYGGWCGVWVAWFLQFVFAFLFLNCAWVSCCCACSLVVLVTMQILALFVSHIARAFSCDVFGTAVCMDFNIVFCFCGGLFTSLLCSTHFLWRDFSLHVVHFILSGLGWVVCPLSGVDLSRHPCCARFYVPSPR